MKVLLLHPLYPTTFWSFKYALKFISKKAILPPLGLITISAMLPESWERKLVDLNVTKLNPADLEWADIVFISAMNIQRESVDQLIKECKKYNRKIVAGGPLFTQCYEEFSAIDHLVLNEAEITLSQFLKDLQYGTPQHLYQSAEFPDITETPIPDYKLLPLKKYSTLSIQYSRGCPFSCDFCEIPYLFGHKVRTKRTKQILTELDLLYNLNWRGQIFIVDDNFIGNKKKLKSELLPELIRWMKERKFPFEFITETSIDLADDEELMDLMSAAGFNSVFIGIETPEEKSLEECKKVQNRNRDLLLSIRKINNKGMQVSAGFIVGFDSDTASIFQRQIDFIQQSGIITAMVGLLNAPKNTKLYRRLHAENRILPTFSGNNTDFNTNIIPRMSFQDLQAGYRKIIREVYSIKPFYQRIRIHLKNCHGGFSKPAKISISNIRAFFESILIMGFIDKGRFEFWKLFGWSILRGPGCLINAIAFSIYGYHFRKVYELSNQQTSL